VTRNHDALTRVWAAELDPRGVTVNAVAPGLVDTAMLRAATVRKGEEAVKGMVARHWVTGQVLATTGGLAP
jgi:NAD(P)-dependent dehydrogenase (short-subunit alcohol dehydrogenase family)